MIWDGHFLSIVAGLGSSGATLRPPGQALSYVSWPAKAGHPRLSVLDVAKSWVAGPSPAMTVKGESGANTLRLRLETWLDLSRVSMLVADKSWVACFAGHDIKGECLN